MGTSTPVVGRQEGARPEAGGPGAGAGATALALEAPIRKELKELEKAVVGLPPSQAIKNILTALKKYGQVKAELLLHSMLISGSEHYVVVRFIVNETVVVDALLTISDTSVVEVDYDVYEYKLPEVLRRTAALKILGDG